jgi:phosphoadenosine phosphosulfate reductase
MKWCCTVYKLTPIAIYNRKNRIKYNIRGVRRGESPRREDYNEVGDDKFPWITVDPILDWREKDVWRYIRKNNLPINPLYQLIKRVGCWCCPFNNKKDWGAARDLMPSEYEKFKELINENSLNIDKEWRRYYVKGGWSGWAYKTELNPVATLLDNKNMLKVEKKLNCVGCGACGVFKNIRMGCIARNYANKRKVAL